MRNKVPESKEAKLQRAIAKGGTDEQISDRLNKKLNLATADVTRYREIQKQLKQSLRKNYERTNTPEDGSMGNEPDGSSDAIGDTRHGKQSLRSLESATGTDGEQDQSGERGGILGSLGDPAGTVSEPSGVEAHGGSGMEPSPEQTRNLSQQAKLELVRSAGGLSDAETAKLTPDAVENAYKALYTNADVTEAKGNQVIGSAVLSRLCFQYAIRNRGGDISQFL
jgi:hypothetical protein